MASTMAAAFVVLVAPAAQADPVVGAVEGTVCLSAKSAYTPWTFASQPAPCPDPSNESPPGSLASDIGWSTFNFSQLSVTGVVGGHCQKGGTPNAFPPPVAKPYNYTCKSGPGNNGAVSGITNHVLWAGTFTTANVHGHTRPEGGTTLASGGFVNEQVVNAALGQKPFDVVCSAGTLVDAGVSPAYTPPTGSIRGSSYGTYQTIANQVTVSLRTTWNHFKGGACGGTPFSVITDSVTVDGVLIPRPDMINAAHTPLPTIQGYELVAAFRT